MKTYEDFCIYVEIKGQATFRKLHRSRLSRKAYSVIKTYVESFTRTSICHNKMVACGWRKSSVIWLYESTFTRCTWINEGEYLPSAWLVFSLTHPSHTLQHGLPNVSFCIIFHRFRLLANLSLWALKSLQPQPSAFIGGFPKSPHTSGTQSVPLLHPAILWNSLPPSWMYP